MSVDLCNFSIVSSEHQTSTHMIRMHPLSHRIYG